MAAISWCVIRMGATRLIYRPYDLVRMKMVGIRWRVLRVIQEWATRERSVEWIKRVCVSSWTSFMGMLGSTECLRTDYGTLTLQK